MPIMTSMMMMMVQNAVCVDRSLESHPLNYTLRLTDGEEEEESKVKEK